MENNSSVRKKSAYAGAKRSVGARRLRTRRRGFLYLFFFSLLLLALLNLDMVLAVVFPIPYGDTLEKICAQQNADFPLVLALIRTESRFDPKAVSSVGAVGLMQIMPETAVWIAGQLDMENFQVEDLRDIETNLTMGIWYLNWLKDYFQGDLPEVLAAYNAGPSRVKTWKEEGVWDGRAETADQIPYGETSKYVKAILRRYEIYRRLYG